MNRNRILWILQILFGVYFIGVGISHFVVPDGLPGPMEWMYDLSDGLHAVAGTAEILGGIGLIVPALTKIQPRLVPMAAAGLVVVMLGAAIWHIGRGEPSNAVQNVIIGAILGYIAYGRYRLEPIEAR